jgi:hypothetical protein
MSKRIWPCEGRRVLVFSIMAPGWKWSCNWPGVRLGRPCKHTEESE